MLGHRTYLAKRRLDRALSQIPDDAPVNFTVRYMPYQLYPEAPQAGEDKFEWYKRSKYGGSEEKMNMYTTVMSGYGEQEGIRFRFGGTVANTMPAHRLIHHFQEHGGPRTAEAILSSLYRQYFEEERHPSSDETLLRAATDAGIAQDEARAFIEDREEGLMEVRMLMREQASNQIDAVPHIVIEGKRRDVQLEGAKEVGEYASVLNQIIKESV